MATRSGASPPTWAKCLWLTNRGRIPWRGMPRPLRRSRTMVPLEASKRSVSPSEIRTATLVCARSAFKAAPVPRQITRPTTTPGSLCWMPVRACRRIVGHVGVRGNGRVVDLRVDDHPESIRELIRIRYLHSLYFGETSPDDVIAVDGDVRVEVADALLRAGYYEGPDVGDDLFDALSDYV